MKQIKIPDKNNDDYLKISCVAASPIAATNSTFFKTEITASLDGCKSQITTDFESYDFEMLLGQLQFLYERRIEDFMFSNIDSSLELLGKMDGTGNVRIDFTLRKNTWKISSSISIDQTYLPHIIEELSS